MFQELITDNSMSWLEIIDVIGNILVTLVGIGVPIYVKYILNKEKKPHDITAMVIKRKALRATLRKLQTTIPEVYRISAWAIHNGGYYYTGEPIQRITMIEECNLPGAEEIKEHFQSQLIGPYLRNIEKLLDNDYIFEYNEQAYDDTLAIIHNMYGVISYAIFKITNKDGFIIGLLSIGFKYHTRLDEKLIEVVKETLPAIRDNLLY